MSNRVGYVEYNPNNSGGHWWLDDEDWKALEKVGWKVAWADLEFDYDAEGHSLYGVDGLPQLSPYDPKRHKHHFAGTDGRYMGALARYAYRVGLSLKDAVAEWESVTGQCSTDAGCPCCGNPHKFYEYDADGKQIASGPETHYEVRW